LLLPEEEIMRRKQIKREAARLIAEGRLTFTEVAQACEISIACLTKWRAQSEFQARVAADEKHIDQQLLSTGIANPLRRLRRMNARWDACDRLMQQRAQDPTMKAVPGSDTGLLHRVIKVIDGQAKADYEFDKSLMSEVRALEAAAHKESSYTHPQEEISPEDGDVDPSQLSDEELEQARRLSRVANRKERKVA
jgi:hypothetical protein